MNKTIFQDAPGCAHTHFFDGLPKKVRVTGLCPRCFHCFGGRRPRPCTVKRGYLCLGFCSTCYEADDFVVHLSPLVPAPYYFRPEQVKPVDSAPKGQGLSFINPLVGAMRTGRTTSLSSESGASSPTSCSGKQSA